MEFFTMLFVLSSFLFSPSISTTKDIITPTVSLRDGESLVSSGGTFELGFFSPGNSKNRYVGIWYNGISPQIVVWVANRETPLTDHSAALNITDGGVLVLFSDKNSSLWSSNFTSRTLRSPVAQLLESGNLVVKDGTDDNSESNLVWQSFDYPSNTLLPGMKLGWNLETGINRSLSSWKAAEDPSPGEFSYSIDHSGYPQLVLRKGRVPHYRLGSWNGLGFTGSPELTPNEAFKIEFVSNDGEAYYKFDLMRGSMHSRLVLNLSGSLQRFLWIDKTHSGNMIYSAPADRCDTYNLCGAFAFCKLDSDPLCSCVQGFEPKSPRDNGTLKNTSSGCLRKSQLSCTNQDGFRKFIRVKLPDTSSSRINYTMSLDECKKMCLTNCSCTAYANLDVRGGGTGCLLWFGDLIDIKEFDSSGQDLFVRMPPSELDGATTSKHSDVKRKVAIIVSSGAVVMGVPILGLVFYIRKKKSKARGMKNIREKNFGFEGGSKDMELITFDLATISRATDNFSNNNKLGQGGFGPVYKGILMEGQVIAVKRLSKCSGQGTKEFMNEVVLIAKLQHRNLVKLLGCCIEGDEKMLIYEYMPNKSLDHFIFDDTRSKFLNWDQRINIIGGIARGLLYLHQDSRLRIIHRDLKTSNVLLDKDMNPKISDFGTAREFGGDQTEENTNRVVGTYGYMSPEYVVDGLFSVKSDVYSFGVMVLEILSGKKNRGFHHPEHQLNLLGHAWMLWIEGRPTEIMDEKLDGSCALPEVSRCIHIALLCVQQQPEDRPNMASVVLMLAGEGSLPRPKQPGFFTERNSVEANASSPSKYETYSINEMSLTMLEARF